MSCVTPVMELGGELAKGSEALRMLRAGEQASLGLCDSWMLRMLRTGGGSYTEAEYS